MTFSTLIIGVAFLPLFTMTGVSGVIFAPMAQDVRVRDRRRDPAGADAHAGARVEARFRRRARRRTALVMRALIAIYNPMFDRRASSTRTSWPAFALVPILATARALPRCSAASSCRSSRRATSGSARRCPLVDLARPVGQVRRPHARDRARLPGRPERAVRRRAPDAPGDRRRSSRSSAGPTTGRTCRASTTSSSSRPSSRSTSGRAA